MHKRKLHHAWTRFKKLTHWHLLAVAIAFALISVVSLRNNNLTALKLRDELLVVDQQNGDVNKALNELRAYIHSHMNTNLSSSTSVYPPIQLKYRYERLVQAEKDRVEAANKGNMLYNDAQNYCEKTQPQSFLGAGRLDCIKSYIDTHPSQPVEQEKPIPDSLYKFDFASPVWSPDLAGWSMVLSGLFFVLFAVRFGLDIWLRNQFKHHA